jgi:hypothetical protein
MRGTNQHGIPAAGTKLRVTTDRAGRPIRVFLGTLEITHLVARVQSITTMAGTAYELVLPVSPNKEMK